MGVSLRTRVLAMGLRTVLGGKPQGFFIPYRYAASTSCRSYPALEPLFVAAEPRMARIVDTIAGFRSAISRFGGPPPAPRFEQDWFPRLDGAAAYALVRSRAPRRIVEIGSGHSTRFMARAVLDAGAACDLICIDPSPRAKLMDLPVRHVATVLANTDPRLVESLEADDVLFIDSSHITMPGTDVDRLLGDVLPRLAPGVVVHFHDMFLPDAYPSDWSWRGYNEQLPVACLLQGGGYEIMFSSHWLASRRHGLVDAAGVGELPLPKGAHETSLWLVKSR